MVAAGASVGVLAGESGEPAHGVAELDQPLFGARDLGESRQSVVAQGVASAAATFATLAGVGPTGRRVEARGVGEAGNATVARGGSDAYAFSELARRAKARCGARHRRDRGGGDRSAD